MIVRMWEATVAPGRLDDAVGWARVVLVPQLLGTEGCMAAEILRHEGTPARVLVQSRWDVPPRFEERWPDDAGLLLRARAHQYETV